MKRKIAVLGMGQGGLVAAAKLAKAGFDVDVFEREREGEVSYPWFDDITFNVFDAVGIPAPPREDYTQKSKWLFVSPNHKDSLPVPPMPPMVEVSVSRRGLNRHLCALAKQAGAKLHFEEPVKTLVFDGDMVVGFETDKGVYEADLVIDAAGLNSPFRGQLPESACIPAKPEKDDIMYGYRGFFEREPGSKTPDPESVLHLMPMDGVDICWCNLNERDEVDMLILNIGGTEKADAEKCEAFLKDYNEVCSDKVVHPIRPVRVGVRATMPVIVADGYAAVGDSAFMTMPFMGSGIEASMKAGKILAEVVIKNKKKEFTAKNLWKYETRYVKELGAVYMLIDVVKRWALNLDPKDIEWAFGSGLVTSDDMKLLSSDSDAEFSLSELHIGKKLLILFSKPSIIFGALKSVAKAVRGLVATLMVPKKYNQKKVQKWAKKYDSYIH